MPKGFAGILFVLLLGFSVSSFAQADQGSLKVYSGYLHLRAEHQSTTIWHALFGARAAKKPVVDQDRQCAIEFHSPTRFTHQSADVIPQELTYFIKFKKAGFERFEIKVYTNDGEDYTIDPNAEGRQVGVNDAHHIFDSYLIYLILGSDINHLEVVTPAGDEGDKYILDKLEIRNES